MTTIGKWYQSADWKSEKHVPVIEAPVTITANEIFPVTLSIGKEVPHPNTTGHHIRWIQLFFKPEGEPFTYQVGNFEFTAHGESAKGDDEGGTYTHHSVTIAMQVNKPGTLIASSFCNIHGLWENAQEIFVK